MAGDPAMPSDTKTGKRTPRLLLTAALLAFAIAGAAMATERELPYRIDPSKAPVPDGTTLLLWRFEDGKATDSSIGGNQGKLVGQAEGAEAGRFGKGLRLHGGLVLFTEKVSVQHLVSSGEEVVVPMVDFWCKPKSYPTRKTACLLDIPGRIGVRLELTPRGHLRVSGSQVPAKTSEKPLPLGEWSHVAVQRKAFIQPNRIYLDKLCMAVMVNGFTAVLAKMPRWRSLSADLHPFGVGNSLRRDAGFDGWMDEFRISRGAAGFYQLFRQDFLRPGETGPPVRSPEHFRLPSAEAYAETFDEDGALQRVVPPPKPELIRTAPPVVRAIATGELKPEAAGDEGEDEPDFVEEMIEGEKQREKMPPAALVDGVRGKALVVRGGLARIELAKPLDLPEGSFEFWFKPGNWDNLATPPGPLDTWRHRNRYAHLLTLWGVPREGDGESVPLVALSIRRDRGQRQVAPEFEKYFAKPSVPIVPHKWVHVLVTWGGRFPYLRTCEFDGKRLERANLAPNEIWQTHRLAYVTLGNGHETYYDELRAYTYALEGAEHFNARVVFTGEPQRNLAEDDVGTPVSFIGDLKIAAPGSPLFYRLSGGWKKGWVTGIATEGPVRAFFGYRLCMGKMIVAVALKEPGSAQRAEVVFHLPEGWTIKGTIPEFQDGKGGVLLDDVGVLPEGGFPLTGTLLNAQGEKVSAFKSIFRRVPIPWLNNKLGLPETPPPTFEPVTLKDRTVTAVGREYTVGPDGNFQSLVVNGESILASPIRFVAQVGERAVTLGGAGAKFGPCTPVEVGWESKAAAAGIEVRTKVQFEYDGMARYDLDLRPGNRQVSIDRLALRIPLKEKYAWLLHAQPCGGSFRGCVTAGALPRRDGPLWDSKSWSKKMPVAKRVVGNFASMIWLGGPIRGLVWFADNDRGWVPSNEQPAAAITRKDGVVTLTLQFIGERFVLDEPRRITYGLLATPPKPLPKDHRLWNRYGDPSVVGPISWRLTSCDAFAPWKVPPVGKCFDYWPRDDDWDFAKLACDTQVNLWKSDTPHGKYPKGTSLVLYHDLDHCPVHPGAVPYFGWVWRCRSFPQSRVDHLVWYIDKWIPRGIDGLYIDDSYPNCDWNEEPVGVSYFISADGKDYWSYDERDRQRRERLLPAAHKFPVHPGMDHFRHRQYLKRLYAVFHSHGKRPILTTHMTDALVWPYHSFVTVIYDGEHGARGHGANKTYIDAWPLDYLMTIRNAERSGLITVNFGLQVPDNWRQTAPPLWKYVATRSLKAVILLFDSSHGPGQAEKGYYGTDVEVFPFWRNEHLVKVEPVLKSPVTDRDLPVPKWWTRISDDFYRSIAKQPLRATLYKKGNRCMVVVVNFLRRSIGARVALSLDELGVPTEHRAGLTAADLDNWLPPRGTNLENLHIADLPKTRSAALLAEIKKDGGFPDVPADTGIDGKEEGGPVEAMLERPEGAEFQFVEPEEPEEPVERDKFFNVSVKDNVLSLNVAPHNFRAIELRWGPSGE